MNNTKAFFNWSGGKDSAMSLYRLQRDGRYPIACLLTSINKEFQRISMHGVRRELLEEQARLLNIPLEILEVREQITMPEYNELLRRRLSGFKQQQIEYAIFGDIFLEDLKKYREDQLSQVGIKGVFPIWKESTHDLIEEFLDLGFKAITVCVNEKFLDRSFVGRVMDRQFFKDLPANVDPCGENGEYHSFVFDGPILKEPVRFKTGEIVYRRYESAKSDKDDACPAVDTGFWYCDLLAA